MSIPYNDDISANVVPGGEITLQAMFQTYAGSGFEMPVSDVQLTITPAGSTVPAVGPTSDVTVIDQATYAYRWYPPQSQPDGDYIVTWTATGQNGPVTITQAVRVVALPTPLPEPGVYATVAAYQRRERDILTPVDIVEQALLIASETMDEALIGAVYPTDADGMPTYADHIATFERACCAQVSWLIANGDLQQVKGQYASTSMGGVSQTRGQHAQGQVLPTLGPRAAQILHVAGVLGTAPLVNW